MKICGSIDRILLIGLVSMTSLMAQTDPRKILDKVQERFDAIEDYQVKVNLKVDIPNFRMPNKNMQVFYKKPDKVKVKTSGFAVVPRFGLVPSPTLFLNDSVRISYLRSFSERGTLYHVVAIYPAKPEKNSADIFLRINTNRWTIDRVMAEFQKEGTTEINISYQNVDGFWLPDTTQIEFNLQHSIPPVDRPNINRPFGGMEQYAGENSQPVQGHITITFSNFIVNRRIKDAVFEEED